MSSTDFLSLMVLFDSELRKEVFLLMELVKLKQYTHFIGLHGSTETGKKENSATWPGSNEILLILMPKAKFEDFKNEVERFKKERTPPPGILLFSWNLTELS